MSSRYSQHAITPVLSNTSEVHCIYGLKEKNCKWYDTQIEPRARLHESSLIVPHNFLRGKERPA